MTGCTIHTFVRRQNKMPSWPGQRLGNTRNKMLVIGEVSAPSVSLKKAKEVFLPLYLTNTMSYQTEVWTVMHTCRSPCTSGSATPTEDSCTSPITLRASLSPSSSPSLLFADQLHCISWMCLAQGRPLTERRGARILM